MWNSNCIWSIFNIRFLFNQIKESSESGHSFRIQFEQGTNFIDRFNQHIDEKTKLTSSPYDNFR